MSENLMDIAQLAEYLQMNKMTVYKLARQGKVPAFKVASEWRFKKELIDAWLMSQLKEGPEFEEIKIAEKIKSGKTLLVVDDDKAIQDFFERALKDNYDIVKASSGEEALEIVSSSKPDLILLDIRMPGINGIETLKRIKEIDNTIAVIMLSAYGTLETNLEAVRLGAFSSIAKPFDLSDMKSVIRNSLVTAAVPGTNVSSLSKPKIEKPKQGKSGKEK